MFVNSGPIRPLLIAAVLAWLAGARPVLPALLGIGVVTLLLPLPTYVASLKHGSREPHPLRAIRECAAPLRAARRRPVVFSPAPELPHSYYYYLRRIGQWRWADGTSPDEIRLRAQGPRGRTLLILSEAQYEAAAAVWTPLLRVQDGRAVLTDAPRPGEPRVVSLSPYRGYVMLLPERYRVCADDVLAAHGAIMVGSQRVEAGF